MDLARSIDVFTLGFAAGRSLTHPCVVERKGPLWHLHDGPRKDSSKNRSAEVVVLSDQDPASVVKRVRGLRTGRHVLCVLHPGMGRDVDIEAAYKGLGYRCVCHEPMFVRELPPVPRPAGPLPVRRVITAIDARSVAKAARSRQIDHAAAEDDQAAGRLFAAYDGDRPVGWVTSVRVDGDAAWVANLYVESAYRGRGIGKALMKTMLRDDAGRGLRHSVLTASQLGTRLYPRVGYGQIGTLQAFRLKRG